MSDNLQVRTTVTRVAVAAFLLVNAALLLPGYLARWNVSPPSDAEFYVAQAFERRARVYDETGRFGILPPDAVFGAVTSFACAPSSSAPREFGWRGARSVRFDCPATFVDTVGRGYAWVFRLVPDKDFAGDPSPEGYRTMGIDVLEVRQMLKKLNLFRGSFGTGNTQRTMWI